MRLMRDMSLKIFVARLGTAGWGITEDVWQKVEAGRRQLNDSELVVAITALGAKLGDLDAYVAEEKKHKR